MEINWIKCESYEKAEDYHHVIYLHEWSGKPFYWGIANTFFGGNRRELYGKERSSRYNPGYKHWIEGCLQHGACLFIGELNHEEFNKYQ